MNRRTHKYLFVLLLSTGLLSACKDDWEEINLPIPDIAQMTISEDITSDGGTVAKKDQYLYENGKLKSHNTIQEFYEQRISQTTTFAYSGNEVVITYESGNAATYTLGTDGYATRCTYQMAEQVRTYQFTYSNGYLTQVDEAIDGTPFMSNTLTYNNGDITFISFGENNKVACSTSEIVNYGHLPFIKLADLHPLSMHIDAMYAHLLGKPTQHMVSGYEPVKKEGSADSPENEETSYTYATDDQQRVTVIQEKTTYTGYIYDDKGKPHLTTDNALRKLTISHE